MKNTIKYISICVLAMVAIAGFISLGNVQKAKAKQSLNFVTTNTSRPLSTTTQAYMSAGTGTTTLSLYTMDTDQIGLNIFFNASSTTSILKWHYEYSINGQDWYAQSQELSTNATTTVVVRDFAEFSWTFASSTGGSSQVSSTNSTDYKHVDLLNIASQFTRIVFYMPAGSAAGSVYIQAVLKQNNSI